MDIQELQQEIESLKLQVQELSVWKRQKEQGQIDFPLDIESLIELDRSLFWFYRVEIGTTDPIEVDIPTNITPAMVTANNGNGVLTYISDTGTKNVLNIIGGTPGAIVDVVVFLTSNKFTQG